MESFVSLLQKNVLNRPPLGQPRRAPAGIVGWIERTYHRRRRQEGLGGLTPIEFEMITATPQTA